MTTHLVVDIETVRDERLPFSPKPKFIRRVHPTTLHEEVFETVDPNPFPPPTHHKVVCIGYCVLEDYIPKTLKTAGKWEEATSEEDLLRSFGAFIEIKKPTLVTFNGRRFDLPVLMTRALQYGIAMPWWFSNRDTRYRYSTNGHFDIMDFMSDYGAAPNVSMDAASKMLGLPGKLDSVDGAHVDEMMREEDGAQKVKAYCLSDVVQETLLFLRLDVLRGVLSPKKHDEAVMRLRDLVTMESPSGDRLTQDFMLSFSWTNALLKKELDGVERCAGPRATEAEVEQKGEAEVREGQVR